MNYLISDGPVRDDLPENEQWFSALIGSAARTGLVAISSGRQRFSGTDQATAAANN